MTVIAGRYELGASLGSGGMATVVAAHDRRLDRQVAVKLLRAELDDPAARARIEREARSAASFSHPNAVTVYDYGEHDGRPFVVMELIDGPSLHEVLQRRGPLPVDEVRVIGDQILAALGAAHARGLVHRDVKPANVLCPPGAPVKLADFGIAKAFHDAATALTATGQMIGTPAYLSPEQVGGHDATPRSDLYAVGVVLYELLAGARPFVGDTPLAVAIAHQQAAVPPLADRRPDLDPGLLAVVAAALAKDPAHRPADAESMRAALAATTAPVERTAVLAAPPPLPTVVGPGPGPVAGRRPLVLAAVAVLAVIGLGVVAAALGGGDGDGASLDDLATGPTSSSTATSAPPVTPTTAAPSTTAAPVTTVATTPAPVVPLDPGALLGGLAELLDLDLDDAGRRGRQLEERLDDVLGADDGGERAEEAARAVDDIEGWLANGDIDPEIGQRALALLTPLADGSVDPGGGGDDEDEDDDDDDD